MRFAGARPSDAANTEARARSRVRCAFSKVLGIAVLFATGLFAPSCGEDSLAPSTPELPREPPNRAPMVTRQIEDITIAGNARHRIDTTRYFSDPDGDSLSVNSYDLSVRGVIIVQISGRQVTLVPRGDGVLRMTLSLDDPGGLSVSQSFQVTVRNHLSPDDHGDTEGTATTIGVPSSTEGHLERSNDVDVFRFRLDSSGRLVAHASGPTDVRGLLRGPSGLREGAEIPGTVTHFRIIVDDAPAGDYYMSVRGIDNSTGMYALHVQFDQPPPPRSPDDHGNTLDKATIIGVPSSTEGELEHSSDSDVFRFLLESSGRLTVETTGGTDTLGDLRGPGSVEVVDEDSGSWGNFRIVVDDAPTGYYYVVVLGEQRSTAGRYELHVRLDHPPPDDHGDTRSTATSVGVPSTTGGNLDSSTDSDYFRFRLNSSSRRLIVYSTGPTNTTGSLETPDGFREFSDDSGEGRNFRIVWDDASVGDYYLRVRGGSSDRGPFELHVRVEDPPPPADDHGDTESTATQISVPSRTDGDLEQSDDVDVFRFHLSSLGRLYVETTGQTDTAGELRGPDGLQYGDDDSGEFKNFWIEVVNAPAGDYYVDVWGYGTGRYELHLAVDYGWTAPPISGVWWEVTTPPDYFISESEVRCGRNDAGYPGPGVYVSWDLYPDAEYFDLQYRRPDREPSWLDVGSLDGEGVLVDPYREEVCFEHWGFGLPVTVDLRLRAVLYDGSTSDWNTILDIPLPANPLSAAGGQVTGERSEVALSDRAVPRRQ